METALWKEHVLHVLYYMYYMYYISLLLRLNKAERWLFQHDHNLFVSKDSQDIPVLQWKQSLENERKVCNN